MNTELAHDIHTSGKQGFRRLQIEEGQTGFFEGRCFRSLVKIRLSRGGIVSYKFSCIEAFILEQLRFAISSGNYEVHIWSSDNVEEKVISSTPVPIFNKNLSDERRTDYAGPGGFYESKATITTGGTITVIDPTQFRDYVEMASPGLTCQKVTAEAGTSTYRYLPAGATFFLEIVNIGKKSCRGVVDIQWEERPPGVK
jgi:hypothetical protein